MAALAVMLVGAPGASCRRSTSGAEPTREPAGSPPPVAERATEPGPAVAASEKPDPTNTGPSPAVAVAPTPASAVEMSLLGEFHGEEVPFESGTVLALRSGDGGSRLEEASIEVRRVHDAVVDAEGEATGKRVTLAGAPEAEESSSEEPFPVLLRGPFVPGAVDVPSESDRDCLARMLSRARPESDEPGSAARLASPALHDGRTLRCTAALAGRTYQVELVALQMREIEVESSEPFFDIRLTGPDGEAQTFQLKRLEWIGDLDRDGRIDLLLENADHYNVSRSLVLHLSSIAPKGAIASPAATFRSVGC